MATIVGQAGTYYMLIQVQESNSASPMENPLSDSLSQVIGKPCGILNDVTLGVALGSDKANTDYVNSEYVESAYFQDSKTKLYKTMLNVGQLQELEQRHVNAVFFLQDGQSAPPTRWRPTYWEFIGEDGAGNGDSVPAPQRDNSVPVKWFYRIAVSDVAPS